MKYNFIFDENFLGNRPLYLSQEEQMTLRVIICGGHSAIFYGYKPERLVNAIKLLTRGDIHESPCSDITFSDFTNANHSALVTSGSGWLFMENLHKYEYPVIEMTACALKGKQITLCNKDSVVTYPTNFQFVATTNTGTRYEWARIKPLVEQVDIVYECKEPGTNSQITCENLSNRVFIDWEHHKQYCAWANPLEKKNCDIKDVGSEVFFTTEGSLLYNSEDFNKEITHPSPIKVASIARSIADCADHRYVHTGDLRSASLLYNVGPLEQMSFEGMPY